MVNIKIFKKVMVLVGAFAFTSSTYSGTILLTQFDFAINGGVNVYEQMQTNLEADGHTVNIIDAKVSGNVASALGSTAYDQVMLFDLTSSAYLSAADIGALSSFWDPSMGLVVDTRAYGYHFQGNDPSEVALIQNVAEALDLSGGGIWFGTDHDPSWTHNANPVLSAIGINPATGSFGAPVNVADPTSFLLGGVIPTDLWGGGQTVAEAPIGIQPNGLEMFMHFGHARSDGSILPYISASFDLAGPDPDPDTEVPEPGSLALIGLGLTGLGLSRRKKA